MRFTVSMAAICAAWALAASGAAAGTLEVLVLDRDGKPTPDAVVIVIPSGKGQPKTGAAVDSKASGTRRPVSQASRC